jgi:predicted nicotinamide N-methyase
MAVKDYDLDQPIDVLINLAVKKFGGVEFEKVVVGDVTLEVLQIKNMQQYIDKLMDKTRAGQKISLPLWAKVWPSSLILSCTLTKFSIGMGSKILELGAGSSINGLVLAKRGFDVTITDIDADALLFSKINALKNGLGDSVSIVRTDFADECLGQYFEYIVGCEVLYDETGFESLVNFLGESLAEKDSAEIIFAIDQKRQARRFFELAGDRFSMMKSSVKYKEKTTGDENIINLFRLKRKSK